MEKHANRPSLPTLERFKKQFRMKYGREMTAEEIRFFQLADELLHSPPEEESEK